MQQIQEDLFIKAVVTENINGFPSDFIFLAASNDDWQTWVQMVLT